MNQVQSNYHSYLLRLWQVKTNGNNWRATLEDVETGDRHGFPSIAALIGYLEELTSPSREKGPLQGQKTTEDRDQGVELR
jgi:hypothetical protein